jgi:hypothetical protein
MDECKVLRYRPNFSKNSIEMQENPCKRARVLKNFGHFYRKVIIAF